MEAGEKVHFGLKWMAVSQVTVQLARFGTNVVLARLLVPEMFGLIAMANVAINVLGVVRELGFGAAYIQRPIDGDEARRIAANTTFVLSAASNLFLFALASLAAPLIADGFQEPAVTPVLRFMFASFLFDALLSTPSLVLQKDLEFGRLATAEIFASAALAIVAIGGALAGWGVWSLVAGHLASKACHTVALYRLSRWRPRWEFDGRVARELFTYGKYLWAFGLLSAIGGSLDRMIMGRVIGASTLGVYSLALNLALLPTRQITTLVNRISFPALSAIQRDPERLRRASRRALSHVSFLSVPLGLGMSAVSPELVATVYGDRWEAAGPVLQVLAFYGMLLSISAVHGPVFRAIGKPDVMLYTSVVHQSLLIALLFVLAPYGVIGICFAVLLPLLVSSTISFVLVIRYLQFRPLDLLAPLLRSGTCAGLMYAGVEALQRQREWLDPHHVAIQLLLAAGLGVGIYAATTLLLNRETLTDLLGTARSVAGSSGDLT